MSNGMTFSQHKYIKALVEACEDKNIEVSMFIRDVADRNEEVSKDTAGEIIEDLKFELGWRRT